MKENHKRLNRLPWLVLAFLTVLLWPMATFRYFTGQGLTRPVYEEMKEVFGNRRRWRRQK